MISIVKITLKVKSQYQSILYSLYIFTLHLDSKNHHNSSKPDVNNAYSVLDI